MKPISQSNSGRALPLVLGLVATFAVSGLLGYLVAGPAFLNRHAPEQPAAPSATAPAETAPATSAPAPVATPVEQQPSASVQPSASSDGMRLKVQIDEPGSSGPSGGFPERSPRRVREHLRTRTPGTAATEAQTSSSTPQPAGPSRPAASATAAPAKAQKKSGGSLYRVHVGDYGDEGGAQKAADDLRAKGQNAYVTKHTEGGRDVYRVQAGLFRDKKRAERLSGKLKDQGVKTNVLETPENSPKGD